jgi:hypothetical protein
MEDVKRPDTERVWDLLIVAPLGDAAILAGLLRLQLLRRNLRVKMRTLPTDAGLLPLPIQVIADASRSRFCVVLALESKPGSPTSQFKRYMYTVLSAPSFPGQVATIATPGATSRPGEYEMGMLESDMVVVQQQMLEILTRLLH